MDGKFTYNGMLKENIKFYFRDDRLYVEEFDTEDGSHHIWTVKRENWTDDILKEAKEKSIIK